MSDQQGGLAHIDPIGNLVPDVGGGRGLPPSLQILLNEGLYNRIKQLSGVMARARGMTPTHLVDKPEACFAIINLSLDWKLSPHFVARHTYQTPGGQIGFDGALVQAVLEQSGRFVGGPSFEYRGNWESLTGKFEVKAGAKGGSYAVPTWKSNDATGLGVIVRWKVKGESTARVWPGEDTPFWLTQCFPLNSPLWATDPKTQIQYLAIRRFANLTSPGILGAAAFDQDELLDASDRAVDVTEPRRADFYPQAEPVDERPEFAVVDNDGVEHVFRVAQHAAGAISSVLNEAARQGIDRLDGAWENNQGTVEQLVGEGYEEATALCEAYATYRKELTSPPPPAPSGAAVERPGADAGGASKASRRGDEHAAQQAQGSPQESETPAPSTGPAKPEPAHSAPTAPAADPPQAEPQQERESLLIQPPLKAGKPDYRTWAVALFLPKVRQQRDGVRLSYLLGDNEANLEEARAVLPIDDLREFNATIDQAQRSATYE